MHMCEPWWLHCTSQWGAVDAIEWACILCGCCIQNDQVSRAMNLHQFCVKPEHSSVETIRMFRRPQLWATGDWQLHHDGTPTHASRLMQSFWWNVSSDSAPLKPRFGALQLLAFPKTKIIFEREEISNNQWESGKYDRAADGDWENCVRSQGAYFEGD